MENKTAIVDMIYSDIMAEVTRQQLRHCNNTEIGRPPQRQVLESATQPNRSVGEIKGGHLETAIFEKHTPRETNAEPHLTLQLYLVVYHYASLPMA
ncbi:hypothetical protein B7494_g2771 [Chlorociboria aeruginascens]|nr:hypothetical protein B7494_g2771 [Chlorociboria aeruginascens]